MQQKDVSMPDNNLQKEDDETKSDSCHDKIVQMHR